MSSISYERRAGAAFLALAAGMFAGVATAIFATSIAIQVAVAVACALSVFAPIARRLPVDYDGAFVRHRRLSVLWAMVAVLAIVRLAGLSMYMANADHPGASPMWFEAFYVRHSCFSAGWKAATLVASNPENIYDANLYDSKEGRFELDAYEYPPQFLILPQALVATGGSFLQLRAAWFVIEGGLFLAAVLVLCGWIGGAVGKRAALWSPAIWLSSPVLLTLQVGNFQLAALSLALLAMVLFERGKVAAGGALLAFSLIKIFPGVLCAYLLFARRWKALGWTIAFLLVYSALAWVTAGPKPFHAFVDLVLPQMVSGELWWAWLDDPDSAYVNAMNDSIPALLLKLKQSGFAPGVDHHALSVVSSLWSVVVVGCAWLAARRAPRDAPWSLAACWIALLGLASLRSPFVPDHNGLIAGVWLWLLVVAATATAGASRTRLAGLCALWLAVAVVMPFHFFMSHKLLILLQLLSTTCLLSMVGLMLWSVLRRQDGLPQRSARVMAHRALVHFKRSRLQ